MEIDQLVLLESRMQFDLVNGGNNTGFIENSSQMIYAEIRYADRFSASLFLQFGESAPCFHVAVLAWLGPMNQIKIDIIQLKPVKALIESFRRRAMPIIPKLGRDI